MLNPILQSLTPVLLKADTCIYHGRQVNQRPYVLCRMSAVSAEDTLNGKSHDVIHFKNSQDINYFKSFFFLSDLMIVGNNGN